MRKHLAIFVTAYSALLALSPSANGQDWIASVFPDRNVDLGTVARGSKVRHTFRVINTTNQEIRIVGAKPKCGCTDVVLGARVIPPATQTTIEVTLDTTRFENYKASGLTLTLDRPSNIVVDLNLSAFIRGDVRLTPGNVDFGVVPHHTKQTRTLTLNYYGGRPGWRLTKIETNSDALIVEAQPSANPSGGTLQYVLTATLEPTAPNGYFKDEISLITNDPSAPRIPISVSANIQAAVMVSPGLINLGTLKVGQTVTKTVLVRAAKPFKVVGFKADRDELTGKVADESQKGLHTATLTFKAPAKPGPFHGVLEIQTSLEDEEPGKLTVFATIVP